MASSNPNDPSLVENKGIGSRILVGTDEEAVSDNLDSEKLCVTRLGLPIYSSLENNVEKKLTSKMCDLSLGLNKTFDANRERSEVNEARKTVVFDKTLNKFTAKSKNQSIVSDSEDSLGIINDVLGNCSFDLLDQFKCEEKIRENLIKKSGDVNFLTFSPLPTGVFVSENGSPMMCRFTSTPEPSSSIPPLKEPNLDKWYEDFKKGNIMASTSKVPLLNDLLETATNITIEENGSPILSATFNITPEPLEKVSSPLHVDAALKNKTFTLDEENKVNASSAENNEPKVIRVSSSPVLGMSEGKQRQNEGNFLENKLRSEALLKAVPIQKCNPPEIQSRLNSTLYMTSKSSSTTKLNRRYSFGISEPSKISLLKKPNQMKSNHFYNSNEPKLPEKKTAITSVPRKRISIGTTAESLTKPKQIIKSSFSAIAVKPQVFSLDEKIKGKVSLEHTFTKGDGMMCGALSPIIEKEGSLEVGENGTLSMVVTQKGNADTSMPSEHGTSSDKGVGKTAVLNEGLDKVSASKMQCVTKPKVFSKNELLSVKKKRSILLESQSSNLNEKFKVTETIKDRHHSRLPVFGSMMPKNHLQRAFPNQCARTSSTKSVLRPPKIFSKENMKFEVPIVSENSSCHEKATLQIPSQLKKQASKTYSR